MHKIIFYLLTVGFIVCSLNPALSQTGKKLNLGFNINAFSRNDPGPNAGVSGILMYNLNKIMSLYVSGGFLHKKERGYITTISVPNENGVLIPSQVLQGTDRTFNFAHYLLGTRFLATFQKTKPYLSLEYGSYFALHKEEDDIVVYFVEEPNGTERPLLAVGSEKGHKNSINIGLGFLHEIGVNKILDISVIFDDYGFAEDSFRFNVGMLWGL